MTPPRVLDVSSLPEIAFMHRAPLFWAALGVVFIEGTMFLLLVSSYFYARQNMDVWPPPGVQFPHIALPTLDTLLLIASAFPAWWATKAGERNDLPKIKLNLIVNGGLGAAAMVARAIGWSTLNFNWKSDIHGSLVWMMLTLHTFEMVSGIIFTFVLVFFASTGRWRDTHRKAIDFDSVTWFFLVGIWLPLYFTIYIAPHLVQAS